MMIALVKDHASGVLLLPPGRAEYAPVARDFIRDELYGRFSKNQSQSQCFTRDRLIPASGYELHGPLYITSKLRQNPRGSCISSSGADQDYHRSGKGDGAEKRGSFETLRGPSPEDLEKDKDKDPERCEAVPLQGLRDSPRPWP